MPLNKSELANKIAQLMSDMMERENTSIEEFANRIATAVDEYVKSATIVYQFGLTAPNGSVTGTFNGNLE